MRTMNHEEPSQPLPIRASPYAHQTAAYEFALKQPATALLMEMGCGKSLTAIAIAGRLYLDGKIGKALVVAPLSIVGVWEEEFSKFAGFDYTLAILTGTLAKKTDTLRHLEDLPLQVAVVNYESA
jgi:SNF2 family DNA or RNA helicase